MDTVSIEPLTPQQPKPQTKALRQARALAVSEKQQKDFNFMLHKKPSEWEYNDHRLIHLWYDADANPANRVERERLIAQLHKPGKEWNDDDFVRMGNFLTQQKFIYLSFLSKIRRTQIKHDESLVRECAQEFFSVNIFRNWLKNYDPERGGLLSPIKKILICHAIDFFQSRLPKMNGDSANDSINTVVDQDNDNPAVDLACHEPNSQNGDDMDNREDKESMIETLENEKVPTLRDCHEKDETEPGSDITPEIEYWMMEIQIAIDKFLQGLPHNQGVLYKYYQDLKGRGGKSDVKVAALMTEQGLLNSDGNPYMPDNIRTRHTEINKKLKLHLIKNGLLEKDDI
jgi:hypothetical protein